MAIFSLEKKKMQYNYTYNERKFKMDKKSRDNRANQMNPNNPLYYKSRGQGSGSGARRSSQNQSNHSGGNYRKSRNEYVIYIVTPRGNGGYFIRFSTEELRYGFLKLKKDYYTTIDRARDIDKAKKYPTRDAAAYVADQIKKKFPRYNVSIIAV